MANIGHGHVVQLTEQEKKHYESLMEAAQPVLQGAAKQLYEDSSPKAIKELRNLFRQKPSAIIDEATRSALRSLQAIESTMIAAYVRLGVDLASAFEAGYRQHGVQFEEYMDEVRHAIWDAMYSYSGNQAFSTYVYWCIKNRLITFTRSLCRKSGVNGRKIKGGVIMRLDDVDERELAMDQSFSPEMTALMREVIRSTELTALERDLVEAHLRGDKGYRSRIAETENYPTKQRLSQIFLRACAKLRRNLESRLKAA